MAIQVTVEDGSSVVGANSYQSVAGARTYALNRGLVLDTDDDVVAAQLIKSMDYLARYTGRWKGVRTYGEDQALPFPRTYIYVDGVLLDSGALPVNLVEAQSQLVMAQEAGIIIMPNTDIGLPIIREKIGPMDTTYAEPATSGNNWQSPSLPVVDALLAPLFQSGIGSLRTVRV